MSEKSQTVFEFQTFRNHSLSTFARTYKLIFQIRSMYLIYFQIHTSYLKKISLYVLANVERKLHLLVGVNISRTSKQERYLGYILGSNRVLIPKPHHFVFVCVVIMTISDRDSSEITHLQDCLSGRALLQAGSPKERSRAASPGIVTTSPKSQVEP